MADTSSLERNVIKAGTKTKVVYEFSKQNATEASAFKIEAQIEEILRIITEIPELGNRLRKPIVCYVTKEKAGNKIHYEVHSPEFDIREGGDTEQEAMKEFISFLLEDAEHLMQMRDEELHLGARRLKHVYQQYVK